MSGIAGDDPEYIEDSPQQTNYRLKLWLCQNKLLLHFTHHPRKTLTRKIFDDPVDSSILITRGSARSRLNLACVFIIRF